MDTIGTPFLWLVFGAVVVVALLADLVLMRHGGPHKVGFKEAAWWSVGWVALALAFNAWLWWYAGQRFGAAAGERIGMEFLTGYLVEKALAVDNIFVFLMIFGYFAVPEMQRQRALVIGIIGAIALRAVLIFAGALLLSKFHWILYVFGAFLLFTGFKMWRAAGEEPDLEGNPVLRWLTAHVPFLRRYVGSALWVGGGRRRKFTPLFIVIAMIGITDVIFAVDSIPAIFAVTREPFIVYAANAFSLLGLAALYFVLANMLGRFRYLNVGLAIVLVFVGVKMTLSDLYKIPIAVSLAVIVLTLGGAVLASLLRPLRLEERPA
jgi:tellurite resistance protein TerC